MAASDRPVIVVEDDPFPRLIQVVLDPALPKARLDAFAHFFAHDVPDFAGWCKSLRARLPRLYPASVRLVSDESSLLTQIRGARVAVVESLPLGRQAIDTAGGTLRIAQKFGVVLRNIDVDACRSAGVEVRTLRRRANIACAEHAFALMLALARKVSATRGLVSVGQLREAGYAPTQYDRAHTANANWARVPGIRTLHGQQLGIIGLGEIGREVALRATAFGMRILYTQRQALGPAEEAACQARFATLDEVLSTSDFISLHLPATDNTRGIIGARELARIRTGAILVNVSRPQLIDRAALLATLRSGSLGGFGLDPHYDAPGRADDPLLAFGNVIVTPHIAAAPRFNALADFEELLLGIDHALGREA